MKMKWFQSVSFIGLLVVLLIPLMGFSSSETKIKPNQIELGSGGIGVPFAMVGDDYPDIYHEPADGIISGLAGCVPDLHEFDKSKKIEEPDGTSHYEHIVFTAGIATELIPAEIEDDEDMESVENFDEKIDIFVEISSNGQKIIEVPFYLHETPDPNTNKPFWVSAVYLGGEGENVIDLPTGEYNYKFKVKEQGEKGHVLDVWVPKNHKFTIVDSAE